MQALFVVNKQFLGEVFAISRIIKARVSVIGRRLRLITLTKTFIIPDITKTEANNCFIIHCFKENNKKCIMLEKQINQPCSYFAM